MGGRTTGKYPECEPCCQRTASSKLATQHGKRPGMNGERSCATHNTRMEYVSLIYKKHIQINRKKDNPTGRWAN